MRGNKSHRPARAQAGAVQLSLSPVQLSPQLSQLDFKNHCLLCLQPQHPAVLQEVAARIPKLQNDFQPVLHYLTGSDPTYDKSQSECGKIFGIPGGMTSAPLLCPSCHATLAKLYELHEELLKVQRLIQKQTEKARQILTSDGAEASRQAFFAKLATTSASGSNIITSEETNAVAQFVTNLHNQVITAATGKKTAGFPFPTQTPPPPQFRSGHCDDINIKTELEEGSDPSEDEKAEEEVVHHHSSHFSKLAQQLSSDDDENISTRGSVSESEVDEKKNYNEEKYIPISSESSESDDERDAYSDSQSILSDPDPLPLPPSPSINREGTKQSSRDESGLHPPPPPPEKSRPDSNSSFEEGHLTPLDNADDKPSTSKQSLRKRKQQGKKEKPRKTETCEVCGYSSYHWGGFIAHLQHHEKATPISDKLLSCTVAECPVRFKLVHLLVVHLKNVHSLPLRMNNREFLQGCPECEQPLKIGTVSDHLKEAHGAAELIPCKQCPFLFPSWKSQLYHRQDHARDGALKNTAWRAGGSGAGARLFCDLCEVTNETGRFRFPQFELLCQHYFNVHKIGKQFICQSCSKEFFAPQTLAAHVRNMHSSGGEKLKKHVAIYKCDLCPGIPFRNPDTLFRHKIREHDAPPRPCQLCHETFTSMGAWRKHQHSHLGLGKSYNCRVEGCGDRVYASLAALKNHQRVAHNPEPESEAKLFLCPNCGKGFSNKKCLKPHIDRIHLGKKEQRRICEICGEDFASSMSLRRHKLVHTGERPHECPICGQAFRHRDVLNTHVKGHQEKGESFKPNGPMKQVRKRVAKPD